MQEKLQSKQVSEILKANVFGTKKQYCVLCEKEQGKIARHLERSHSSESEVAKALSFPKRSKKQRILLEQLRNQGNYHHNIKVLETGRGEIVT